MMNEEKKMNPKGELDKRLLGLYIATVIFSMQVILVEHPVVEGVGVLVIFFLGMMTDEYVKRKQFRSMTQSQEQKEYL